MPLISNLFGGVNVPGRRASADPLESLDVESQRACETPCNPTIFPAGEVAERLKAAVLKNVSAEARIPQE